MNMKRSGAIVACLLMSVATAAFAADPPQEPASPAQLEKASKLFDDGTEALKYSKWNECSTMLGESFRLLKHWRTAVNLGFCELQLGKHTDAAEHFDSGLRMLPAEQGPEKRAEIEALLNASAESLVTLTIKIDPPDAEVILDGKSLGRGPFDAPMFLEAKPHALEIRAEGRLEHKESTEGKPGARWEVVQQLEPVPAPPPLPPPSPPPPPPPPPALEPIVVPPGPSKVPAFVMGGVAAAALLGGGTLVAAGGGDRSDAEQIAAGIAKGGCAPNVTPVDPRCAQVEDAASASDTKHNAGVGLLVGGAVVAAGAAGYLLLAPRLAGGSQPEQQPAGLRWHVIPMAGLQGAGVIVGGTF